MTCEETKISLHDYVDELLDARMQKEVENHLRTCEACFFEYQKLKKFFEDLQNLPYTINPPDDIITLISSELMKRSAAVSEEEPVIPAVKIRKIKKEQLKQEKRLRNTRGPRRKSLATKSLGATQLSKKIATPGKLDFRKTVLTLLPLAIIALGYYIYDFTKINSPWKVRLIQGTIYINGRIDETGKWEEGTSLYTESYSRAVVSIPNTGRLEAEDNTFLMLVKAKDGNNIVRMERGKIKIENTEQMPDFSIEINRKTVRDRGGVFSLEVDDAKNAKIKVELGYIEINRFGKNFYIDEGYECNMPNDKDVGTPYLSTTPDSLKKLIYAVDYQDGGDDVIGKIVEVATDSDLLTLLALIPKASESYRTVLYNKIARVYPPPQSVTMEGIIKLNEYMLEDWWFEIEWQI
ncbi:MAG: zf-HC2 domain-containing protein [Bacteroidota bacterium]